MQQQQPNEEKLQDFDPRDHQFSMNRARLEELLTTSPTEVPGFNEFGEQAFVAIDLLESRIVFGACDFDTVDSQLFKEFGNDYGFRFEIVERQN